MLKAILAALALLPIFHEDREQPEKAEQLLSVAGAVEAAARTPDEVAFLLAWGNNETHFALRIARGDCRRWECDHGRARGPWQAHRNGMADERWAKMVGVENVALQAEQAAAHARWALRQCPGDRIRGAFRVLGGHACWSPLKGEGVRVADYERVRARL